MAANPAIAAAAKQKTAPNIQTHTGPLADSLNELANQEQRAKDIGARRQADAIQYNAFVLGQQGKLAAAAQGQDRRAVGTTFGIQALAAASNMGSIKRLGDARAAQGISGAGDSSGLLDDQARTNLMMAATTQRAADSANTNAGKAGFLAAASQAAHRAQERAIAGETSQQLAGIGREKVGLLGQRDQLIQEAENARMQAAAAIEEARLRAEEAAADRASRENIAGMNAETRMATTQMNVEARQREGESDRAFRARQNRLNRRNRVTAARAGSGRLSPAETRQRSEAARDLDTSRDSAIQLSQALKRKWQSQGKWKPETLRTALLADKLPQPVVDYVIANQFGRRAGVTRRGQKSAARRYYDYRRRIASGRA